MTVELKLTWQDIEARVQDIVNTVTDIHHPRFDTIIPIPRGGLVPAVMLSHRLHLPIECVIHAHSYHNKGMRCPIEFRGWLPPLEQRRQERVLIVDDVLDTGTTLHEVAKLYPLAGYAVLYRKINRPRDEPPPPRLVVGMEIDENAWLVYPWEV